MIPNTDMCFDELASGQARCKVCGGYASGSYFLDVQHKDNCPVPCMLDATVSVTMVTTRRNQDNELCDYKETEVCSELSEACEWAMKRAIVYEGNKIQDPRLDNLRYIVEVCAAEVQVREAVYDALAEHRERQHQIATAQNARGRKRAQVSRCRQDLRALFKLQLELRPEVYNRRLANLRIQYPDVIEEVYAEEIK